MSTCAFIRPLTTRAVRLTTKDSRLLAVRAWHASTVRKVLASQKASAVLDK
jgi:hypothetical protein